MNDLIRNKNLYKIFLSLLKFLPMILSIIQIILTSLNYFGISCTILTYIGGSSLLFIGLLFMMSYIFRFCYLYRIPLWYITIIGILNLLRYFGYISIDLELYYRLCMIITGIFISLFIGYKYKNRKNPKIDHIKQLCENYVNCCE
jgi:hypothetical protein